MSAVVGLPAIVYVLGPPLCKHEIGDWQAPESAEPGRGFNPMASRKESEVSLVDHLGGISANQDLGFRTLIGGSVHLQ